MSKAEILDIDDEPIPDSEPEQMQQEEKYNEKSESLNKSESSEKKESSKEEDKNQIENQPAGDGDGFVPMVGGAVSFDDELSNDVSTKSKHTEENAKNEEEKSSKCCLLI